MSEREKERERERLESNFASVFTPKKSDNLLNMIFMDSLRCPKCKAKAEQIKYNPHN